MTGDQDHWELYSQHYTSLMKGKVFPFYTKAKNSRNESMAFAVNVRSGRSLLVSYPKYRQIGGWDSE
jgi:hypothetical protein